LLDSHSGRMRG